MNNGNNFLNGSLNQLGQSAPQQLHRTSIDFPQSSQGLQLPGGGLFKPQAPLLQQQQSLFTRPLQQQPQIIQRPPVKHFTMKPLPQQELCPKYGTPYVGFDEKTKEFYCNQAIFEKRIQGLKFTALVVKELKKKFQGEYDKYKSSMGQMDQNKPELVKEQVRQMIGEFFVGLKQRVRELQASVMENIKHSENLKNLEQTLEQRKEFIQLDPTQPDHFEREKQIFDEKLKKGRYAYVVKKKDFYNNLIENLEKSRQKINQTIDKSIEYQERVLRVNEDPQLLNQKISEIVQDCIIIDPPHVEGQNAFKFNPGQPLQSAFRNQQPCNQQVTMIDTTSKQAPVSPIQQQGSNLQQFIQQRVPPVLPQQQQNNMQQQQWQQMQQQRAVAQAPQVMQRPIVATAPIAAAPPIQQQQAATSAQTLQEKIKQQLLQQQQQQNKPQVPQPDQSQVICLTDTQHWQNAKEYQYKTCFKLKSMSVFKLIPTQGWQKYLDTQQLYMAKCIFTLDDVVYTIGGSKDSKTQQTVADVIASVWNAGTQSIVQSQKAKMLQSRASFGCTYNPTKNEIFVVGGYTEGQLTKKCEKYIAAEDKWVQLPELNEAKCSLSLVLLDEGKYLYAVGGLAKLDSGVSLSNTVEKIDLTNLAAGWQIVPIKLAEPACDIGAISISKDEILLFGGWNKNPLSGAYILKKMDNGPVQIPSQLVSIGQKTDLVRHELRPVEGGLERPDFFMTTGVAMKTDVPQQIKICGHTQMFTFDLKQRKFVATSNV
ncbi:hypothetical protein FGO68_gene13992 [Halteria grandinella]|uniref:Uncharacterized protein n=1 Tax=Halteria grandinella TaxID=5974 RepID=A0A8J8NXA4_HALGN|nr:hypothetical protein FGO68_gene13992 [Halteria grandinella]